eukprot:m.489694 g.489694  ORF g.489694 m.489694 type:complete len:686 (+) comp21771_c0_seq2:195-2252(+)
MAKRWSAEVDPEDFPYFYGKIERSRSEKWLSAASTRPGVFLIRLSSSDPDSYTLSLRCEREVVHFQIHNHGECWYSIDNGPMFVGIQDLVEHYSAVADGLPLCLKEPYPKNFNYDRMREPARASNRLHNASYEGDVRNVQTLSTTTMLREVNGWGRTALHEAVRGNRLSCVEVLLNVPGGTGLVNVHDKQGWTPLHMAAFAGFTDIAKLLISARANHRAKTNDDELPRNLAARFGKVECSILLGLAELGLITKAQFNTRLYPWYHGKLTRASAEFVLARHGNSDGLFLVRQSTNSSAGLQSQRDCVLSMSFEGMPFHYQVKADSITHKYNIDDGPAFTGLDSLVAHYSSIPDGLARCLQSYCLIGSPAHDASQTGTFTENAYEICGRNTAIAEQTPSSENKINVIPPNEISEGATIGSGNFGDVKAGMWNRANSPPIPVALKTLRDVDQSQSATREFFQEASDMTYLQHPYVVSLLGVALRDQGVCIVLELVPLGSLETFLRKHSKKHSSWCKDGMPFLHGAQICLGMEYLESKRVVHRDLATRNILLKTKYHSKISDFGLSRTLRPNENYYTSQTGGKWPIKWYAPESVNYGKFTHKSDIFSFGVTMWEIYTAAKEPWGDLTMSDVLERLNRGERLQCPKLCPADTYEMMQQCWLMEYDDRPTFHACYTTLKACIPDSLSKHIS